VIHESCVKKATPTNYIVQHISLFISHTLSLLHVRVLSHSLFFLSHTHTHAYIHTHTLYQILMKKTPKCCNEAHARRIARNFSRTRAFSSNSILRVMYSRRTALASINFLYSSSFGDVRICHYEIVVWIENAHLHSLYIVAHYHGLKLRFTSCA